MGEKINSCGFHNRPEGTPILKKFPKGSEKAIFPINMSTFIPQNFKIGHWGGF